MEKRPFGRTPDGRPVDLYTLRTRGGLALDVATYGATVTSLRVPDRHGRLGDVVLGFDSLDGYLSCRAYLGAIIGRYGNRIANARFPLGDETYRLAANDGKNHLHGGARGFDKVVWTAQAVPGDDGARLLLSYTSRDGEEGYPGTLEATVAYTLAGDGEMRIDYGATTDKPTVVNLTHHSYFNLAGAGAAGVLDHELAVDADRFTAVDGGLIPTGELRPVAGTPFDFRRPTRIGARIGDHDAQLAAGRGYDHNFVLNRRGPGLCAAARLTEAASGRVMEVLTTEPGLHLYTGNLLDGRMAGRDGRPYGRHAGLCLETQHFPDSPNQPAFPSTRLDPGETYASTTVYRFCYARRK